MMDLTMEYDSWMAMRDSRVENWPLLQSPVPSLCLSAGYLVTVWLGNHVMASREPFELRRTMQLYNAVTVMFNSIILWKLVNAGVAQYRLGTLTTLCAEVDYTNEPASLEMAFAIYLFYLSKVMEFIDSFVMVLRKKTTQLSFLHLYHHSTMFPIWWIGVNWVAGGNSAFAATINSGIHVIMYTYYFLASMGIDRRWLWWKRWLTQMQIAQFFAVFAHAAYANWEVWTGRCKFPLWMGFANLVYMVSMITLFGAFYINSYARNGKTGKNGASKKTE